ncbi:MAG: universal stress protein [Bdellovibrionota bacterium]
MEHQPPIKTLVWAVDPFAEDKELQRPAAWAIRGIAKAQGVTVIPVYILRGIPVDSPVPPSPELLAEVQFAGQESLEEVLRRVEIPGLQALEVLPQPRLTLSLGVSTLLEFAKSRQAEIIALSTHVRKRMARFMMGSFTETLLQISDVPLLVVRPNQRKAFDFRRIVFPSDFSEESREAFREVLPLAREIGSRITIFHQSLYMQAPAMRRGVLSNAVYREALSDELREIKKEVHQWVEEARAAGVHAVGHVELGRGKSAADAILEFIEERPCLVALASRSGPVETALLGSTSRKLVRTSPYPVWVVHPKLARKAVSRKKAA